MFDHHQYTYSANLKYPMSYVGLGPGLGFGVLLSCSAVLLLTF